MALELDHGIASAKDAPAAPRVPGERLGVPWSPTGVGPFSPVYVNDGLTVGHARAPG